jgi:uncharacterized protein (AIM24 family)
MPSDCSQKRAYGTEQLPEIAFNCDGAGHVFALHLKADEAIDVREHQFLAATDAVSYTFARVRGADGHVSEMRAGAGLAQTRCHERDDFAGRIVAGRFDAAVRQEV